MNKIVVNEDGLEIFDYLGCWYSTQCNPQPIYLYIEGESEKRYIEVDGNVGGNCMSSDVFHGIDRRFCLNVQAIRDFTAERLIEELKPLIEKFVASYQEKWNGNNYIGHWDEEIAYQIDRYISDFDFDDDIGWIDEEQDQQEA